MIIEGNEKEKAAMAEFHKGNRKEGLRLQEESMIIELTGTQSKLEGFMNLLKGYEILELARTGITGLSRGCEDVTYIG